MKKTLLYSFLPCLMAMLMCATFTACSDDDDDNNAGSSANTETLIGKWQFVGADGSPDEIFYIFNNDGTGYFEIIEENGSRSYKQEYTYKLEGNAVTLYILKDNNYDYQDEKKIIYLLYIDDKWALSGECDFDEEEIYNEDDLREAIKEGEGAWYKI